MVKESGCHNLEPGEGKSWPTYKGGPCRPFGDGNIKKLWEWIMIMAPTGAVGRETRPTLLQTKNWRSGSGTLLRGLWARFWSAGL